MWFIKEFPWQRSDLLLVFHDYHEARLLQNESEIAVESSSCDGEGECGESLTEENIYSHCQHVFSSRKVNL